MLGSGYQANDRNASRSSSALPRGINRSISAWVWVHNGNAFASRVRPAEVIARRRLRLSSISIETFTSLRRSRGLRTAVNVVRSMASRAATLPMVGGSGRFSDINRENWPWVRSRGRNTSSKRRANPRAARCTCRHRQLSRTRWVAERGNSWRVDMSHDMLISTYLSMTVTRRRRVMQVQSYLFFDGRCDEAIEFYKKTLGAQVGMLMRFKDSPDKSACAPGSENKVMHASLTIGDTRVMASDGRNTGNPKFDGFRSEERRVGKECRSRWSRDQ